MFRLARQNIVFNEGTKLESQNRVPDKILHDFRLFGRRAKWKTIINQSDCSIKNTRQKQQIHYTVSRVVKFESLFADLDPIGNGCDFFPIFI